MIEKTRKIVLVVFLSLLILMLISFSLSWARYTEEMPSTGDYTSDLEYIVADQVEIGSVDDFFTAIENGYTNLKIADDLDNPLIITGGIADVHSSLTIDLNGHELQRNNREAMLNIKKDVLLTIIDSSPEKTGCFYNPVGNVLQVSGGTLTTTGGTFESGPRNGKQTGNGTSVFTSEYAVDLGSSFRTDSGAQTTQNSHVVIYTKNGDGYLESSGSMPVIIPMVTASLKQTSSGTQEWAYSLDGNMYFDASAPQGILPDTYVYFTVEGENTESSPISASVGSADFYYSYYLQPNGEGNDRTFSFVENPQQPAGLARVTIYGYNSVKGSTQTESYAAIKMASGNFYVRGGHYYSYFGNANTFCVNATGGYMAIEGNSTFEAHQDAVCVNINYINPTNTDYLRVESGRFYSERGDTIHVQNGSMYVTGGNFYKDCVLYSAEAVDVGDNNSSINITGGDLTITGSASSRIGFFLDGSHMHGIESVGGEVIVTNADFAFNKNQPNASGFTTNVGVFATSGVVTVNGCVFTLPGEQSCGVYVASGTVNVNGAGGTTLANTLNTDQFSYFYLDQAIGCYGVFADGQYSNATLNVNSAQIFVGQHPDSDLGTQGQFNQINGAGVYSDTYTDSTVTLGNVMVLTAGHNISGIYVEGGQIEQLSNSNLVVISGARANNYEAGVTQFDNIQSYNSISDLENLESKITVVNNGDGVKHGYGVICKGGSIRLGNVYTSVYGSFTSGLLTIGNGTNQGDITVNGYLALRVLGADNVTLPDVTGSSKLISASGISTEQGSLTLNGGGEIYVQYGLGVSSRVGNVIIANNTSVSLTTMHNTAVYVDGGNVEIGANVQFTVKSIIDGQYIWCPPPDAPSDYHTRQYDSIYVKNGSFKASGILNIDHTGLPSDTNYVGFANRVVKSYAVCVQGLQSDSNIEVIILKGSIVNTIGGGVYVEGGNVTLGALNNDDALLSIEASGIIQETDPLNTESNLKPDWRYRNSSLGGNAVEARGGTLKILSGTYVAEQGHGIYVRAGNVTISGGLFQGYDSYANTYDGGPIAGYGASYAFFAMGGTININGGTFGVNKLRNTRLGGSGAFLTGESTTSRANVNISKAQFTAPGHAGITIYNYANVNFGNANTINSNDNIYVEGANVGLVVERGTNSDTKSDAGLGEINIYSGKYVASTYGKWADGIWYGNREIKLNIFGGEFIGNGRAGMRIETAGAVDGAISITGGDFKCLPDDTVATVDEFVGAFSWLKSGFWTQELFVRRMIDINNYQVRNVPSNEIITIYIFSTVNNIFTNLRHVRIEPKS